MDDATNPAAFAQAVTQMSRWSHWTSVWYVSALAAALACLVGAGAFYAGRQAAMLDLSKVTAMLKEAQQRADAASAERDVARKELEKLKLSMGPALKTVSSHIQESDRIRELTAQVNSYRNLVETKTLQKSSDSALAAIVSRPGARLLPFKFVEPIPHAVVSLVVAEGGTAAFVASNLPERHYQLWFVKRDKEGFTRGQSFTGSAERTILELGAGTLTGVTQVLVIEGADVDVDKPASPPVLTLTLE